MPRQPGYPATRYHPTALVDLSVRSERERLSPAALRAFFNIMTRWQVRDEDARALLGGVSNGPLYSSPLADAWMSRPNSNAIFAGQTPLAYLVAGGLPAMQVVRRLLDARRAG